MPENEDKLLQDEGVDSSFFDDIDEENAGDLIDLEGGKKEAEEEESEEEESEEEETEEEETEEESEEEETEEESEEESEEEETEEETEEDDGAFFDSISEDTGLEINDSEDLVNALNELRELKETDPFESLPEEVKMVMEAVKSGGDYMQKLRLLTMNTDSMSEKEVLRQNYTMELSDKGVVNERLAAAEFDQFYKEKYGVLEELNSMTDEFDKEQFIEENSDKIELAKLRLEQDVVNAKGSIEDFKNSSTSEATSDEPSMTEEERQEILNNHYREVENVSSYYDGIDLAINDNAEENFHLKPSEERSSLIKETLKDPRDFLEQVVGVDPMSGQILDYNVLAKLIDWTESINDVSKIGQYYLEKHNERTVDSQISPKHKKGTSNRRAKSEEVDLSIDPDF
tara:strand:- start:16627 stop:17826 length:1200 start_codon:yes stop_codon:yes gene_type:complete